MRKPFKDHPIGAIIVTPCGQPYKKRSKRTIEAAPGHTHYEQHKARNAWYYASMNEPFTAQGEQA